MLPDYPKVKRHVETAIFRFIEAAVNESEPILALVTRTRQHEGESGLIARADETRDTVEYKKTSVPVEVSREEMRSTTLERVLEHALGIAREMAAHQAKTMFEKLAEVTEQTGNSVDARGDAKAAWLEMEAKVLTDFDPETLEPKNQVLVIHPSQVGVWKQRTAEWENDPAFVEARERVRKQKLEEWRARENSRRLVD